MATLIRNQTREELCFQIVLRGLCSVLVAENMLTVLSTMISIHPDIFRCRITARRKIIELSYSNNSVLCSFYFNFG